MTAVRLAYELLAEIFKIYMAFSDTSPETLSQVCRSWKAVANNEPILWTKFVVGHHMLNWTPDPVATATTLNRDWIKIGRAHV